MWLSSYKFSNVFMTMQHPWNGLFWGGFWALSFPNMVQFCWHFWQEVVSYNTKTVFEQSIKFFCLSREGMYPKFTVLVHFWTQCWWKNFCCSSIKTCVIPVLVWSFFTFLSPFLTLGPFFAEFFEKNKNNENNHCHRNLPDPENCWCILI